jgi:hypothetical protein
MLKPKDPAGEQTTSAAGEIQASAVTPSIQVAVRQRLTS